MNKYLIIHNKHEGCYDFHCYQDEVARIRLTSITINPPKIYLFNTRDEAQDFFEEYINDVDCIDIRCKRGEDVEHIEYCTCGVIELDDKGEPVLFYNKKNQIFLMEHGPQMFMPNFEVKNDMKNLNLTNRLIRKCKSLGREQRNRYIELGKYCEECNLDDFDDEEEDNEKKKQEEAAAAAAAEAKKKEEDEIAPELKVLKAIPPEGITLEALIYKVGESIREGMGACMKNKWIFKHGDLIMRATPESFAAALANPVVAATPTPTPTPTPAPAPAPAQAEEPAKPKPGRKKKAVEEGNTKKEKEKEKAPRKKKDTTPTPPPPPPTTPPSSASS